MELTRKQFDILVLLAEEKMGLTQRELEKATGYSLGTINKTVRELTGEGLIENGVRSQRVVWMHWNHTGRKGLSLSLQDSAREWYLSRSTPRNHWCGSTESGS